MEWSWYLRNIGSYYSLRSNSAGILHDDPICSWPQLLTNIVNSINSHWRMFHYMYGIYIDKSFFTCRMLFRITFWAKKNTNKSDNQIVRNSRYLAIYFLDKDSNFPGDLYLDLQTNKLLRHISSDSIVNIV